jgi:hypothetical protein
VTTPSETASTTASACAARPSTPPWWPPHETPARRSANRPASRTCSGTASAWGAPGPDLANGMSCEPGSSWGRRAPLHRRRARRCGGAPHRQPRRTGLLLRLLHRHPRRLALDRRPVAGGHRARHRLPLRRRPHPRPPHAPARSGTLVRRRPRRGPRHRPRHPRRPRFARLLAEHAAPTLDDPIQLDRALAAWEHQRDDECRETYDWTNFVARAEPVGPLDITLYNHFAQPEHAHELLDLHSRILRPSEVLTPGLFAGQGRAGPGLLSLVNIYI